ncbi:MAG: hypothetical protein WCK49_05920 [Myxococcaceae bacterium]
MFVGWSRGPAGSVDFVDQQPNVHINSGMSLYAVWQQELINYEFSRYGTTVNGISGGNTNYDGIADPSISYVPAVNGYDLNTGAQFNGSSSYIAIPNQPLTDYTSSYTIGMLFNTQHAGGVLLGYQDIAVPAVTLDYQARGGGGDAPTYSVPILYVGSDGKLNASMYVNELSGNLTISSSAAVIDNAMHMVELIVTSNWSPNIASMNLILDGVWQGAQNYSGTFNGLSMSYNQLGVGYYNGGWNYFNGYIQAFGMVVGPN